MSARPTRTASLAAVAVACLTLGVAGCSGSSTSAPSTSSASAPMTTIPSTTALPSVVPTVPESASPSGSTAATPGATAAAAPFGPGCGSLPNNGQGATGTSLTSALSSIPSLSRLASAVQAAGLGSRLDNLSDITVFAPDDDAFTALPTARLTALLRDPAQLGRILQYHVVQQQLTTSNVAGSHQTLEGATLTVSGQGESYTVNGNAAVVCGNVRAGGATVYVVDHVLMPPS